MSSIEQQLAINCSLEKVYEISKDYSVRYDWDPFPESIEFIDGATEVKVGARVSVIAKSRLRMIVEFIQISPPHVAAVKMIKGPFILKSFSGSWIFKPLPNDTTLVIFKYNLKAKKWAIPLITNKLLNWYFSAKVKARLFGLARYCENEI